VQACCTPERRRRRAAMAAGAVVLALTVLGEAFGAEPPCPCGDVRAELASFKQEIGELRALKQEVAELRALVVKPARYTVNAEGDTDDGRRLQAGTRLAAVPAWQLHEFQTGGTCTLPDNMVRLLPKAQATGAASYAVSVPDAAAELELVSVARDWTATDIQTMPSPFKVVHDASCSSPPTLDLQLSTTVQTLAVNNVDIGASTTNLLNSVAALQAAAPSGNEVRFFTHGSCPSGWVDASSQLGLGGKALMIGSSSNPPGSSQTNLGIQVASTQAGHQHQFCKSSGVCAVSDWTSPAGASVPNGHVATMSLITTTTTAPTGHYLLLCVKTSAVG